MIPASLMVPDLPDEIAAKLLGPQRPHVQALRKCLRGGKTVILDGSDPGTGKTYAGAALCAAEELQVLVCCPKQSVPNHYKVLEMFGATILGVVNYDTLKNGKYYESLNDFYGENRVECPYVTIIRRPVLDKYGQPKLTKGGAPQTEVAGIEWNLPRNSICIFDEAHRGKNGLNSGNTLNSQLMVSIVRYLSVPDRKFGMIVSATITDKYENFDVAGYMLGLYRPHTKQVYTQFITRITQANKGNIVLGLHKALYPKCGSRMTIKAIKQATGDAIFKNNDVKAKAYVVDTAVAMQIEYLHKEIQHEMDAIRSKGLTRGFGYIIRCWQKIETLKAPSAATKILSKYHKGKSITVFVCFKVTKRILMQKIASMAGVDPDIPDASGTPGMSRIPVEEIGFIDGDQSAQEREQVIEDWHADRKRVLICQIIAGGESLSYHDTRGQYQRYNLLFPTWSAIGMVQALKRIYRANAKSDAIQRIYYIKPKDSGFGKAEPIALDNLDNPVEEDIPDFESLGSLTPSDVADPAMREMLERALTEQAHLTVEEKICICVNTKCDNIDMINDGILSGQALF
jgi:hypothetical protein